MAEFFSFYPPSIIAIVAALFFLGGIVKGSLGFGLPLVTMAVLPLFIPVEVALATNAVVTPFNNLAQLRHGRQTRAVMQRFGGMVGTTVIGVVIGAMIVSLVDEEVLMVALGSFVIFFTLINLAAPRIYIPPAREKPIGLATGLVAGVVGALTTANGPIYIMYLVGLRLEREIFISALGLFFIVTGVVVCVSFMLLGMVTPAVLGLALFCIFTAQAGMRIGFWLASRVSAERFRVVVLCGLTVLGANMILQAVL
jgi:uncharacterized membrane protein YfcA